MNFFAFSVGGLITLALAGCGKKHAPDPAAGEARPAASAHADEPAHEELPTKVRLPPDVVEAATIRTASAVREVLANVLALPGEIAADPDKTARVASPVAGCLVRVDLQEGRVVKPGDVLATVRLPELGKLRAAQAAATARAASARSNAGRLRALSDKGLAAAQDLAAAEAEAISLDAEARGLGEQLSVLGQGTGTGSELPLRAPVGGVVVARDAVVGQPVTPEQTLATLTDLSQVWFLGRVFEKDLGRVRVGARAEVQLNAYPDERFEGTVAYLGRHVDPVARTVTARIVLTNRRDLLRVGLFGVARVAVGDGAPPTPVLVVPRSALTEVGGKPVVFVRQADGDFERHDVVRGDASLGQVQILSGLREGEQVVVDGVFTLKSAIVRGTLKKDD